MNDSGSSRSRAQGPPEDGLDVDVALPPVPESGAGWRFSTGAHQEVQLPPWRGHGIPSTHHDPRGRLRRAIHFFTHSLGFELTEDSPAQSNDGRPKRWVVVRPPDAETGILLARADGERQVSAIGDQHAGRVGFFLQVEDFESRYAHMRDAGVEFLTDPRTETYGRFVVFRDIAGNRWDLIEPVGPA